MLGVVPGTLFLKLGSPWIIKVLLGVFIIGLGIEMATRDRAKPHRPNALARTLISFASGFMAGLFGINLLFLAYMERIAEKTSAVPHKCLFCVSDRKHFSHDHLSVQRYVLSFHLADYRDLCPGGDHRSRYRWPDRPPH